MAVFPLKKNEPRLVELARGVKKELQAAGLRAVYDDTGAIGKLYRRQDEIGTPFCITVDFQSLEDETVTVRDRDTMAQERVGVGELGRAARQGRVGRLRDPLSPLRGARADQILLSLSRLRERVGVRAGLASGSVRAHHAFRVRLGGAAGRGARP